MKQILMIISILLVLGVAQSSTQISENKEYDVCSHQGFYSCRLSISCYYDGATATCKKVQTQSLQKQLQQNTTKNVNGFNHDHCTHLGFYACTSDRGCQYTSNGCQKLQQAEALLSQQNEDDHCTHLGFYACTSDRGCQYTSAGCKKLFQTEKILSLEGNQQEQGDDNHCAHLGFYACNSSSGCWIDSYTGRCAKIPAEVESYQLQQQQETDNLTLSAEDDICSRMGFYACNSDMGCWIDPYIGHCAKIPNKLSHLLKQQNSQKYDHCLNLGSYACSSSRGCQLNGSGKCQKSQY